MAFWGREVFWNGLHEHQQLGLLGYLFASLSEDLYVTSSKVTGVIWNMRN
jgi:hypothetical protein